MILINAISSYLKTLDQNVHNAIFRIRQTDKQKNKGADRRTEARRDEGERGETKIQLTNTGGK